MLMIATGLTGDRQRRRRRTPSNTLKTSAGGDFTKVKGKITCPKA